MSDDQPYLWDKSEPSDAFISKLEHVLTTKRSKVKQAGRRRRRRLLWIVGPVAVATAAAVVAWVCCASGGDEAAPGASGGTPPVAVETDLPAGAGTGTGSNLEQTGAGKNAKDLGRTLGQPGPHGGGPAVSEMK